MKRIVITGPESSGKTTLTKYLAETLNTVWVPEFARAFLETLDSPYTIEDLVKIAIGQVSLAQSIEGAATTEPLFIDTWMIEMAIWAEYRFGGVPDYIARLLADNPPDLYLLCFPDIPWEADPLRENQHDRDQLYRLYHAAVVAGNIPYAVIEGLGPEREQKALRVVESWLNQ